MKFLGLNDHRSFMACRFTLAYLASFFVLSACAGGDETPGAPGPVAPATGGGASDQGTGGAGTGGTAGGSVGSGGTSTDVGSGGQSLTGGAATGGSATGGSATGGSATGGSATGGSGGTVEPGATFQVKGRHLYDRCGEQVVLRGVNEMIVWSTNKDGVPEFSEIAKTGANVVRISWTDEGSAAELDTAIANSLAQKLIPMVEHHGATGDLSGVPSVVDYWTRSDVLAVLKKHEADLLLNIANEAGATETVPNFTSAYQAAITRLRDAGLKLPLIIDGSSWGQDIDMLQAAGPALIAHDPLSNLMFSVHMWWHDPAGTRVVSELQESVDAQLPLIVGEFAQHAVSGCDQQPFAYKVLLAEAQKHSIGWLAWSWGGVDNGDCAGEGSFDMTTGGVYGNWEETWGAEVADTDPNSIKNTSVRPYSIQNGACQ